MAIGNLGWDLVLALHILCVVLWVGGMFFAYAVLHPALAALDAAPRVALQGRVMKRFFLIVWHAMPLVVISGFAMIFGYYGGFSGLDWTIHAMSGLGVVMAVIFLLLFFGPWRRFRIAIQPARAAGAAGRIRQLIGLNLLLGLVTIIVASLGHWPW